MSFLDFSIGLSPQYPTVLKHLKTGNANLLDLGCCLAQDLRKLVHDGVPSTSLSGSELEAGFIDLGYDLFRDRDALQAKFSVNDFFDETTQNEVLQEGAFDYIYAASFFHLFGWEEQVQAFSRAVRLLKPTLLFCLKFFQCGTSKYVNGGVVGQVGNLLIGFARHEML